MTVRLIGSVYADGATALGDGDDGDTFTFESAYEPFQGSNNRNLSPNGLTNIIINSDSTDPCDVRIDAQNSGRCFVITNGEVVTIEYLSMINGNGNGGDGGGVYVWLSDVLLNHFIIRDCKATNWGGGIMVGNYASAELFNGLIHGNQASQSVSKYGGGICVYLNSTMVVDSCTVAGNSHNVNGFGGGIACYGNGDVTSKNSIYWGNTANSGKQIYIYSGPDSLVLDYCCYSNDTGDVYNNGTFTVTDSSITTNPLFVTGTNGDYYLSETASKQGSDSPCLDAGSASAVSLGLDDFTTRTDSVCDVDTVNIGYHYSPPTSEPTSAYFKCVLRCTHSYVMPEPQSGEIIIWNDRGDGQGDTWLLVKDYCKGITTKIKLTQVT